MVINIGKFMELLPEVECKAKDICLREPTEEEKVVQRLSQTFRKALFEGKLEECSMEGLEGCLIQFDEVIEQTFSLANLQMLYQALDVKGCKAKVSAPGARRRVL